LDKQKATKYIGIRVTENVFTRVNERADEEGRPVSNLIVKIINDYLDEIDEAKKRLSK
jgi:predicted DNA-binding protein